MTRAVAARVGRIVVGTHTEIRLFASVVRGPQPVLVHAEPGADVAPAVRLVLDRPDLDPVGLHCRLGSRITDSRVFTTAIADLIGQMEQIRRDQGIVLTQLDLGGGHAVPEYPSGPQLDLAALARDIADALAEACARNRFPRPTITLEPGRGTVARAGVTLYRVVSTETSADGIRGVTVHGGALARGVLLPDDLHPGDVLAMPCTGAYHHSLASPDGGVGRPPVVAVRGGTARELVRRETVADLLSREVDARPAFR